MKTITCYTKLFMLCCSFSAAAAFLNQQASLYPSVDTTSQQYTSIELEIGIKDSTFSSKNPDYNELVNLIDNDDLEQIKDFANNPKKIIFSEEIPELKKILEKKEPKTASCAQKTCNTVFAASFIAGALSFVGFAGHAIYTLATLNNFNPTAFAAIGGSLGAAGIGFMTSAFGSVFVTAALKERSRIEFNTMNNHLGAIKARTDRFEEFRVFYEKLEQKRALEQSKDAVALNLD